MITIRMRDMLLSRFLRDRRGGVAPMFALAIIPISVSSAPRSTTAAPIRCAPACSPRSTRPRSRWRSSRRRLTQSELQTKANAYFQAMFNHPEAKNLVHHAELHHGRRLAADHRGVRLGRHLVHEHHGLLEPRHRQHVHGEVGQQPPARRAGARQHRLDGERRQDRRAEDRDQEPAHAAQELPRPPTATSMCRSFRS